MAIYRFNVEFDDEEEVTRTIEIGSKQGFKEFHDCLVQSLAIQVAYSGTFHNSDNDWRKEDEIVTVDANPDGKNPKLSNYIYDPHQRFIYELEAGASLSFMIELARIKPDSPKAELPSAVGGTGEIPLYFFKDQLKELMKEEDDEPSDEEIAAGGDALLKELQGLGDEDDSDDDSDEEESNRDQIKKDLGFDDNFEESDLDGFGEEDFNE